MSVHESVSTRLEQDPKRSYRSCALRALTLICFLCRLANALGQHLPRVDLKRFALLASIAWAVACSNPTAPELVTVPAFIDSLPASVIVGNTTLRLESDAWRELSCRDNRMTE